MPDIKLPKETISITHPMQRVNEVLFKRNSTSRYMCNGFGGKGDKVHHGDDLSNRDLRAKHL